MNECDAEYMFGVGYVELVTDFLLKCICFMQRACCRR